MSSTRQIEEVSQSSFFWCCHVRKWRSAFQKTSSLTMAFQLHHMAWESYFVELFLQSSFVWLAEYLFQMMVVLGAIAWEVFFILIFAALFWDIDWTSDGRHFAVEKQNHVGSVRKSKNKQTGGAQTFVRTQKCLAQFAGEIAQLQNKNLKDVVMSNQAKMQSQTTWSDANNFGTRQRFISPC